MAKIIKSVFIAAIGFFALLASLQSLTPAGKLADISNLPRVVQTPLNLVIKEPTAVIDQQPLQDNAEIYRLDEPGSVVSLYITVIKGTAVDAADSTWTELNDLMQWFDENSGIAQAPRAKAIVQFGTENGPLPGEVGYDAVVPNATVHVRGASPSLQPQLSYQIELGQAAGKWRGQSTIVLNKHINDPSRLRNKLNFDLLKGVPDMVSLRTQFVHLYVRDHSVEPPGTGFSDYGLYTQVELPNQRYLKAHLLDSNGQLYKANFFLFERYPDEIRLVDDPLFDEQKFASRLEIKGNKDNSKLIRMLDNLNDPNLPIETTFEAYFDADNYFTWMAYNILVGNVNTTSQNFYLYSPQNGSKFYFLPWDYDDSFFRLERGSCCESRSYAAYQYGVANYWGTPLANRVLRSRAYRQLLDAKVNELRDILTPERIEGLLAVYQPVVEAYALQMPDLQFLPTTSSGMEVDLETIPAEVQKNYELYLESLLAPMPFHLYTPHVEDGKLIFGWEESYDFSDPNLAYEISLARDPSLQDVILKRALAEKTSLQTEMLPPGEYYWSVKAINDSWKTQLPFESIIDFNGISHPGVKRFYILPDGSIQE